MQVEDCLALLRGLVAIAWLGVAAAALTEAWVRAGSVQAWPTVGGFSVMYNAVMLEFALNLAVLSLLVVRSDWFERVPRASSQRVRWLLLAVIVWLGLHQFYAFFVSGSVHSPLLLLLPPAVLGALLALPGAEGAWVAGYVVCGHLLIIAAQHNGVLPEAAPLAAAFSLATPLGVGSLLVALLATIALGLVARGLLVPLGFALHHPLRLDPFTGLFQPSFLLRRLASELGRAQRRGGEGAALLIIALERPIAGAGDDRDASWQLNRVAQALADRLRFHFDTPTRYGLTTLAALLPAADADGVRSVVKRLVESLGGAGPVPLRFGAALIGPSAGVDVQRVTATAEQAVGQAYPGGEVAVLETAPA